VVEAAAEEEAVSSSASICHGCGSALSGTVFCEDGQSYHFGCRPSQRADTTFRSQREHNDLLARIAELEAQVADLDELYRVLNLACNDRITRWMKAETALAALKGVLRLAVKDALWSDDPRTPEEYIADLEAENSSMAQSIAHAEEGSGDE
jgi:hypothetical protein